MEKNLSEMLMKENEGIKVLMQQGKFKDAIKEYEKLLKKVPIENEIWLLIHSNLAHCYK